MADRMLVATRKGLVMLAKNGAWSIVRTAFAGIPVTATLHDKRDGSIYAVLKHGHFGTKLHRSDDGGETWTELPAPAFPADAAGAPSLFQIDGNAAAAAEKKGPATSTPDVALAAALVDALNQYERMPIQEAIDYVAAKRGLSANNLKNIRQRLRSKTSKDAGQPHYQAALTTIAAQPDPARAIRVQLMK